MHVCMWLTRDYFIIRFPQAFQKSTIRPVVTANKSEPQRVLFPYFVRLPVCVLLDSQRKHRKAGQDEDLLLQVQDQPSTSSAGGASGGGGGHYQSAAYRQHHFYYHTLQQHRLWRTHDAVTLLGSNWKAAQKLGNGRWEGNRIRSLSDVSIRKSRGILGCGLPIMMGWIVFKFWAELYSLSTIRYRRCRMNCLKHSIVV